MQERKVVVSRTITSGRFAPVIEKSIRERINDFVEVRQLLSVYPFSADYAVKAAMGKGRGGGSARNAAADNKAKRQKELKFRRLGIYCYDPKATKKPNQYFETKPRWNLDGQMGDVANVGWLDIPKVVAPDKYNEEVRKYLASRKNQPKIIARPAKKNKRTGQIEVKALGQSIGRVGGNIGQAAARAVGIILDPDGRMRCPPGVPAANQFTDEVGSNCFDFTPAIGRAIVEIAKRASASILEEISSIDGAISVMRDEDGNVVGVPGGAARRVRGGLASRTRTVPGPRGELLGPDGRPITVDVPPSPDFDRDVAELAARATPIPPERYEEVFEDMIRKTYPELSPEKIKKLTQTAVRRQKVRDKQRSDIQGVLDFATELGVDIDPTDPQSVQMGLAKVLHLLNLPEHGGWRANFKAYFGSKFGAGSMDVAMAEHRARQIDVVLDYLFSDPQKFGLTNEQLASIINTKFAGNPNLMKQKLMEVMSGGRTAEEVFGRDADMFKIVFEAQTKWDKMRQQEAGLLIGLIKQRKDNPKLTDGFRELSIGFPDTRDLGANDAVCFTDERGGYKMMINPLRTIMNTEAEMGISKSEFTLFEPDGMVGTEVAKLQAISSSIDAAGRTRARDAYLNDLETIEDLQNATESGTGFQQFWHAKNAGQVGQGMYIMNHEMTHGRQLMLIQNYLRTIPGLADSMSNEDMMILAENLLGGGQMFSLLGRDWDYASIISNPEWLSTAMSNMPEVMQVLLGKNMGGRYAMKHYWEAAHRAPFLSNLMQSTDDLYLPLSELRAKMERMDPESPEFEAAVSVFSEVAEIYNRGDLNLLQVTQAAYKRNASLTIAEMQAEISTGVDAGLIDMTPEIEAFLGPLRHGSDIDDNFGAVNPDPKPVIRDFKNEIRQGIKDTLTGKKARERRRNRKATERFGDIPGIAGMEGVEVVDSSPDSDKELARRLIETLDGMRSRSDVSRANNMMREVVLDAATEQQRKLVDGNWRGSLWNTSDPTDWNRALRSRPDEIVNAVENQFIPFMDLIDSSDVPTDMVAEIQLPPMSLGLPDEQIGTTLTVGKHFTAIVHSAEDIGLNGNSDAQRIMLLVPEGSTGLPDYTPGTQRGEVGSLILPPGEVEIFGRTNDGVALGRITSQKTTDEQLNELRQVLHSLGSSESRPLGQRIVAKRAENRIERRQEVARVGRTQAAVAMEVDPRNSKLANKIEYDPQTRTLKVSYRNGTSREFENVSYGRVRDAGAENKPDKLIYELEKIPREFNPDRAMPASTGLRSSTVNQINSQNRSNRANQKTIDILAKASDIGVDVDRQEREIVPKLIEQAKADRLRPEAMTAVKRAIQTSMSAENKQILRRLAENATLSDLEILRQMPGDDTFGHRLEVLREIADVRGDKQLVGQIDDFIKEVGAMTPEQYDAAIEEAMGKFESPFDKRATVLMRSPVDLITSGRYETVHQGRETQGGQVTGFDVPAIRRAAESQLLNFSGDTDSETTSLRPSSAMTLQTLPGETRARRLRELYGEDIEIQHDAPSIGKEGKQAAHTGTRKQTWKNDSQYGANSIVLRPEVAERTLAINGDSVSDVSTSGSDVVEPGARLSKLSEDGRLASMFFDPLAVLFETRTGRRDTVASAGSNGRKRYVESLTVGSFELSDVESIVSEPFGLRGEHMWRQGKMSMLGTNPQASFTNLIAAARQRDELFEKYGIDVIIDSRELSLDDVEPFNAAMTAKWVDRQISSGQWVDVSPKDVIMDEKTTPYEALLRYRKIRAEKGNGTPLFDHPNNESGFGTSSVNDKNFISMVDDELRRLRPESPRGGLASSTQTPKRGTVSETADGVVLWTPDLNVSSKITDEDWQRYMNEMAQKKTNQPIAPEEKRLLVKVNTVEEAVLAVLDGHDVDMPDMEGAHTLIDDFARLVQTLEQMYHNGEISEDKLKNFVFDLCQVTVKGTSAFCLGNKGMPRYLMPQSIGDALPGTTAAEWLERQNAERIARGEQPETEVDGTDSFVAFLKNAGLRVSEPRQVQSEKLKATQRDMQGHKVATMLSGAIRGKFDKATGKYDETKKWNPGKKPIFVSRDGYVIDGHHRWAAQLGLDAMDGILGNNHYMNVVVVDAPISEIIVLANQWTWEFGIAPKPVAKRTDSNPAYAREVLQILRDSAHVGGVGNIDFGYMKPREAAELTTMEPGDEFARIPAPKSRGLASRTTGLKSSTDTKNEKPQYPRKPSYGPILGDMNKIFEGAKDWEDFKKRYDDVEVTYLDYETTGLKFDEFNFSTGNGEVTQIGAVKVKNGKVTKRFETYVNPGIPRSDWEQWSRDNLKDYDGNLVTDEFLQNKPSVAEAHRRLAEFIGPNAMMGVQNAAFDKDVLEDALKKHGIDFSVAGWIDLKDMASMVLPRYSDEKPDGPFKFNKKLGKNVPSNSLADITKYLQVELGDKHHTADADAEATAESMRKLIEGAIKNKWSTDVLDETNRTNYVTKQQERFDKDITAFDTAKADYVQKQKSGGLASSTSRSSQDFDFPPKPSGRTLGQKLDQGPQELPNGRDSLGIPVVAKPDTLKKKFGSSRRQAQRYFKKKYGIDVEVSKSIFKNKKGDMKSTARHAAGYAAMQAFDDMLLNTPGLQQLLKDNNFSINITDGGAEGRSDLFMPTEVLGTFGPRPKLFRSQRFRDGDKARTRIDINIHELTDGAKRLVQRDWGPRFRGHQRVQVTDGPGRTANAISVPGGALPTVMAQLGLPAFDDSFLEPSADMPDNLPPWRRSVSADRNYDEAKYEELVNTVGARLAYATTVHEFGHLLDFAVRDKSKSTMELPSVLKSMFVSIFDDGPPNETRAEKMKRITKKLFRGGDIEDLYESGSRTRQIEAELQPSRYAATKATEALAEAFAAWFLFARAPDIRTTAASRKKVRNLSGEETEAVNVTGVLMQPAKGSRSVISPLIQKLGPAVKSANPEEATNLEDFDPLVVLYAFLPLIAENAKSAKIGRRRARRINRNKKDDKESVSK